MTNSLATFVLPLADTGSAFTGLILSILSIASFLLLIYVLLDLARYFMTPAPNPVIQFHNALATVWEPVLKPIRNALPAMGGIDFSPLIVLLALQFLAQLIR